jgi:hypothetical protein
MKLTASSLLAAGAMFAMNFEPLMMRFAEAGFVGAKTVGPETSALWFLQFVIIFEALVQLLIENLDICSPHAERARLYDVGAFEFANRGDDDRARYEEFVRDFARDKNAGKIAHLLKHFFYREQLGIRERLDCFLDLMDFSRLVLLALRSDAFDFMADNHGGALGDYDVVVTERFFITRDYDCPYPLGIKDDYRYEHMVFDFSRWFLLEDEIRFFSLDIYARLSYAKKFLVRLAGYAFFLARKNNRV